MFFLRLALALQLSLPSPFNNSDFPVPNRIITHAIHAFHFPVFTPLLAPVF